MTVKPHDYLAIAILLLVLLNQSIQTARYFLRLKNDRPAPQAPAPEPTYWKVSNSPAVLKCKVPLRPSPVPLTHIA